MQIRILTDSQSLENDMDNFYHWFGEQRRKHWLLLTALFICVVINMFSSVEFLRTSLPTRYDEFLKKGAMLIPAILNVMVIFVLLFRMKKLPMQSTEYPRESRTARIFIFWWGMLWLVWLGFYFVFSLEEAIKLHYGVLEHEVAWMVGRDILNNLQSALFFICYFILADPILVTHSDEGNKGQKITSLLLPALTGLLAFFMLQVVYAGLFSDHYKQYGHKAFELVSGVGGGVALALFVSRLESKFVGSVAIIAAILYLYAVIQSSYVMFRFESLDWVQELMLSLAFPLKVLLFAFVYWFAKKGRLLFYLHKGFTLYKLSDEWQKFRLKIDAPQATS